MERELVASDTRVRMTAVCRRRHADTENIGEHRSVPESMWLDLAIRVIEVRCPDIRLRRVPERHRDDRRCAETAQCRAARVGLLPELVGRQDAT